jgi:alkylation response protein AidB-like acyl-CoA dehydrogenase
VNASIALRKTREDEAQGARPRPEQQPARDISATIEALRRGGHDAIVAASHEAAKTVAEHADRHDRAGTYPWESFDILWETGITSLTLPAGLGGVGASVLDTAHAVQIIAASDGGTAFLLKAHLASLRDGAQNWPEPVREEFLKAVLSGPAHRSGSRSDAKGGSPARGGLPPATARLVTTDTGQKAWSLTAHKRYATGSVGAGWFGVWAATAPEDGDVQVGTFLVPADTPGLTILEGSWDQVGMRATVSNDLLLDDAVIPFDHALGLTPFYGTDPAAARRTNAQRVDLTSILEAATYGGLAIGARDWLIGYLHERQPASLNGASLASLPRFQEAVGEIELLIRNSQLVLDDISTRLDRQIADPGNAAPVTMIDTGLARVKVVRNSHEAIDKALMLVGNAGLAYRHPIQRHFRDILCGRVHEPQADVLLTVRGKQVLGLG